MQLFTSVPDFTELEHNKKKDDDQQQPLFQTDAEFVIKDNTGTIQVQQLRPENGEIALTSAEEDESIIYNQNRKLISAKELKKESIQIDAF